MLHFFMFVLVAGFIFFDLIFYELFLSKVYMYSY